MLFQKEETHMKKNINADLSDVVTFRYPIPNENIKIYYEEGKPFSERVAILKPKTKQVIVLRKPKNKQTTDGTILEVKGNKVLHPRPKYEGHAIGKLKKFSTEYFKYVKCDWHCDEKEGEEPIIRPRLQTVLNTSDLIRSDVMDKKSQLIEKAHARGKSYTNYKKHIEEANKFFDHFNPYPNL